MGFLPKQDSSQNRIPLKTGFLPKQNSSQNGIPPKMVFLQKQDSSQKTFCFQFWGESRFERNPILRGILYRNESCFGRNPVFRRVPLEGLRGGRSSSGGILTGWVSWEESLGGVPRLQMKSFKLGFPYTITKSMCCIQQKEMFLQIGPVFLYINIFGAKV